MLHQTIPAELPRARQDYEKALAELGKLRQREKIVDLEAEAEKLVERYYSLVNDRDSNRLLLLKAQGMTSAEIAERQRQRFQDGTLVEPKVTYRGVTPEESFFPRPGEAGYEVWVQNR